MALQSVLAGCGTLEEAVLIGVLIAVGAFRVQTAFFIYICWSFLSDAVMGVLQVHYPAAAFFKMYEVQLVIDSAMIFAVLVELAWSTLNPVRSSLPRRAWVLIVVLIAVAGLLLWPVAGLAVPGKLTAQGVVFFRLQQTFAMLRVVVFLAIAGFSQVLSIGWRNRELQIATGLGFFSVVSLGVYILHTHQLVSAPEYHLLDEIGSVSYMVALAYWIFAFSTKEAERRAFTPQMENFLLAAAGGTRSARITMADATKSRKHQK